jgi:hypothetical protein
MQAVTRFHLSTEPEIWTKSKSEMTAIEVSGKLCGRPELVVFQRSTAVSPLSIIIDADDRCSHRNIYRRTYPK